MNNSLLTKVLIERLIGQEISIKSLLAIKSPTKEDHYTVREVMTSTTVIITTPTYHQRINAVGSEGEESN